MFIIVFDNSLTNTTERENRKAMIITNNHPKSRALQIAVNTSLHVFDLGENFTNILAKISTSVLHNLVPKTPH